MPCSEDLVNSLIIFCVILVILLIISMFQKRRCNRQCCRKRDAIYSPTEETQPIQESYHPGMTEIQQMTGSQDLGFNPDADNVDMDNVLF